MILAVLESPYAGDVDRNLRYLRACMADALRRGWAPYASHALYAQPGVLDDTIPAERKLGMEAGFLWGAHAEICVAYVDFGVSSGMIEGIQRARKQHKRIYTITLGSPWSSLTPSIACDEPVVK